MSYELSDDQVRRIEYALAAAHVKMLCPVCDGEDRIVDRAVYGIDVVTSLREPPTGQAGDFSGRTVTGVISALVICKACGFLQFHALNVLGLDSMVG